MSGIKRNYPLDSLNLMKTENLFKKWKNFLNLPFNTNNSIKYNLTEINDQATIKHPISTTSHNNLPNIIYMTPHLRKSAISHIINSR